jgi:hypothetical protein
MTDRTTLWEGAMRVVACMIAAVSFVVLPACVPRKSTRLFVRITNPSPSPTLARIYIVGDAGVASFEKGEVAAASQTVRAAVASAGGIGAASAAGADPFKKYLNDTTDLAYGNLMKTPTLMRDLRERIRNDAATNKFVLFPGDNVYHAGIPGGHRSRRPTTRPPTT